MLALVPPKGPSLTECRARSSLPRPQAIGHREFDLKLTDRVKMKMVGVPESSFDMWASKFLSQGYKVGRVDQCETALGAEIRNKDDKKNSGAKAKGKSAGKQANGKEIVRRELKSVLTGGTIVDGTMLTDDMSNHCVAIKVRDSSLFKLVVNLHDEKADSAL